MARQTPRTPVATRGTLGHHWQVVERSEVGEEKYADYWRAVRWCLRGDSRGYVVEPCRGRRRGGLLVQNFSDGALLAMVDLVLRPGCVCRYLCKPLWSF